MQNFSGGLNMSGNQSQLWLIYRKNAFLLACGVQACVPVKQLFFFFFSFKFFEGMVGKTIEILKQEKVGGNKA